MKKPNKILILHGWDALADNHWFPQARKRFEERGYCVEIPQMPGNYFPKKDEWLRIVESYNPDENWILIGHSLGGVAILKYLETAPKPVAQVVLIATAIEPMKFTPIAIFFNKPFLWEKIKKNCPKFDIVVESNDPVVPIEHGQELAKVLGVKLNVVSGYSHFHKIDLDFLEKLLAKKN